MLELTISFESSAEESRRRKEAKYEELLEAGRVVGYRVKLITFEVGARGMVTDDDIATIKDTFHASRKAVGSTISRNVATEMS